MLIGPQGPPWWIFFQNFFKNVLVYPQLTQKYVLWHSKLEKSILGRRELRHYAKHALTHGNRLCVIFMNVRLKLYWPHQPFFRRPDKIWNIRIILHQAPLWVLWIVNVPNHMTTAPLPLTTEKCPDSKHPSRYWPIEDINNDQYLNILIPRLDLFPALAAAAGPQFSRPAIAVKTSASLSYCPLYTVSRILIYRSCST